MFCLKVFGIFLIFLLKFGDAKTKVLPEYGKDFILFPSQDGSNRLVPAFLSKTFKASSTAASFLPDEKDVHFFLYTAENRDTAAELFVNDLSTLQASNFVRNKELKILCHGFASSFINPFPANTKDKYLDTCGTTPINVIVVDWSLLAVVPFYFSAVEHVPMVGTKIGKIISFLIEAKYVTLDKIHFVGHSLGAHIGGVAARYVSRRFGRKLARVTGLDPASPLIEDNSECINANVADVVDIIHTDAKFLGILRPLGTVDFYPNGGLEQNGCKGELVGECSHMRSHEYFMESISSPSRNNTKFSSCSCNKCTLREDDELCYDEKFQFGDCDCDPAVHMGDSATKTPAARGLYFLNTNPGSPFSRT